MNSLIENVAYIGTFYIIILTNTGMVWIDMARYGFKFVVGFNAGSRSWHLCKQSDACSTYMKLYYDKFDSKAVAT